MIQTSKLSLSIHLFKNILIYVYIYVELLYTAIYEMKYNSLYSSTNEITHNQQIKDYK